MAAGIETDCLVIGAGPAGLAAARGLVDAGVRSVLIVDRDEAPGGLPQYCRHLGFGWGYTHRLETGPTFARRMIAALDQARVRILPRSSALAIRPGPIVDLVGPECGVVSVSARAVIVATGIRERPRGARLIPGRRPERGVLTTGQLQQMVTRGVKLPGRRMVVVGTEHVAYSVLLTARHAGHKVVAMIELGDRPSSYAVLAAVTRHVARIPIHLSARIVDILGDRQVEAVEIDGPAGRRAIACDSVVFSGDFVPDAALARASGIAIDPRTHGPQIDQFGRTSMHGVFAAGNVLRAVETSGFAAIEGARVGAAAAVFLRDPTQWRVQPRTIRVSPEFAYLVPQCWSAGSDTLTPVPFSLRVNKDLGASRVAMKIGDTVVWQGIAKTLRRHRRIRLSPAVLSTHATADAPLTVCATR